MDSRPTASERMNHLIRNRGRQAEPEDQTEPEPEQATDFDGGARTTVRRPVRMDDVIRRATGHLPPAA